VKVLVVSGIWPPDVGGPASHAPAFADFLHARGHDVEVVTTASAAPEPRPYPVRWVDRATPKGLLHAKAIALIARRARGADVVYATSMMTRSSLASALARRPLVVKAAGDVAYERSRRLGLFAGDLVAFQSARGRKLDAMRAARTAALRRARAVVFPSEFLRGLAGGWGLDPARLHVVPNPAPKFEVEVIRGNGDRPREAKSTLAFAGRLFAAKALEVALAAIDQVENVELLVVGDGEERARLEAIAGDRVRFLGARPREEVLRILRDADVVVLSSRWENFPHVLVEALEVGTPVVATRVGGVSEIVEDGVNGLLVAPDDPDALAVAIRSALADRDRLAANAAASVERFSEERVYGRLEELLGG
jgi:glycosyltransferase involved in cell wall biosynthesis